jgi:hypothetical protein
MHIFGRREHQRRSTPKSEPSGSFPEEDATADISQCFRGAYLGSCRDCKTLLYNEQSDNRRIEVYRDKLAYCPFKQEKG